MPLLIVYLAALTLAQPGPGAGREPGPWDAMFSPPHVAVVELFTSEGCSSCPPADALLSELVADAAKSGKRVYPLAFHVDYWDHLGWKDAFATPEFTARQKEYARVLNGQGTYTPQMVVNGTEAFVGSERERATAAIAAALQREPGAGVWVETSRGAGDRSLIVDCDLISKNEAASLRVAVVERGLETKVGAGENGGRTLRHESVVRELKTIPLTKHQFRYQLVFDVPAAVNAEHASVIAFVQDPKSGQVLGAGTAGLPAFVPDPVVSDEDLAGAVVTLKRTFCLGTCPDYDLTVRGDGSVVYHGRMSVAIEGIQKAAIPKEEVRRLIKAFLRSDYFGLKDRYVAQVTDSPSTTTSLAVGGRMKSVFNYVDGPERLRRLEDLVDEVAGSKRWVSKAP